MLLAVALVTTVFVLPAVSASATSGTMYIDADTTLTEDHHGPIVITANDINLDCGGNTVAGDNTDTGITLEGRSGVTVENCHVEGFADGFLVADSEHNRLVSNTSAGNFASGFILLNGSTHNVLKGNVAERNRSVGFSLVDGASHNTIADCTATVNGSTGFAVVDSTGNRLRGNAASGNTGVGFLLRGVEEALLTDNVASQHFVGFRLDSSDRNILRNNGAFENDFQGFDLRGSSDNVLRRNSATRNGDAGFSLVSSSDPSDRNVFFRNEAHDNGWNGFSIFGASENDFRRNSANGNSGAGFNAWLFSADNEFSHNDGCDNGTVDAEDTGTGNVWTRNEFCTTLNI